MVKNLRSILFDSSGPIGRRGSGLLLLLLPLVVCIIWLSGRTPSQGAEPSDSKVVTAERFVLKGKDGKVRGEWGVDNDGVVAIKLFNDEGASHSEWKLARNGNCLLRLKAPAIKGEVLLEVAEYGAALKFLRNDQPELTMGATDNGHTGIFLAREQKLRGVFSTQPDETVAMHLYSPEGQPALGILSTKTNTEISLHDPETQLERITLGVEKKDGYANLEIRDKNKVIRTQIGMSEIKTRGGILKRDEASIFLFDKNNQTVFAAPQLP